MKIIELNHVALHVADVARSCEFYQRVLHSRPCRAQRLISWLTISPGTPQVYAPLNLLVVPVFFCLWCWPVLRGRTTLPIRFVVLLILAVVLSAASLIFGARYGVAYQNVGYVVGVAVINIACWALLSVLAFLARRSPSFRHNLGFHAALFAWLAWCAFPYLGELP